MRGSGTRRVRTGARRPRQGLESVTKIESEICCANIAPKVVGKQIFVAARIHSPCPSLAHELPLVAALGSHILVLRMSIEPGYHVAQYDTAMLLHESGVCSRQPLVRRRVYTNAPRRSIAPGDTFLRSRTKLTPSWSRASDHAFTHSLGIRRFSYSLSIAVL